MEGVIMKKMISVFIALALVFNLAGYQLFSMPVTDAAANGPTLIDSFDDYGRLDTENKKEGLGAAKELASGSGTAGVFCGVSRGYSPAKDLSAYADSNDAYVHIWFYIEHSDWFMSAPKDAYLELSSSGAGWTAGAVRYDLSGLNVVDGWNELFLPLSDFRMVDGVTPCDWSNVNFFRLYIHNAARDGAAFDQVLMVDELSIGLASDFERLPKHRETMIESFDKAAVGYSVSTDDKKEGDAAAVISAAGLTLIERSYYRTKNLSFYQNNENSYVHFWLYVDNVEYVNNRTDGRLELSSSGGWGSQVTKYDVKNMKLKSGWNEIFLPVSGFEILDPDIGECDWSKINYVRFYMQNASPTGSAFTQTVKLDGLEVGVYEVSDLPQDGTLRQIESYDKTDTLLGAVIIDTENKTEGAGSAMVSITQTGTNVLTAIESRYTYARNLSFYQGREDAYFHLSIYVENADFINNQTAARLELSSGTGWGAQVDYYDLAKMEFKDGWNELYLPVNEFRQGDYGTCDWSSINYTRVYLFHNIASSGQTFRLDNFSIGLESDFEIQAESTKKTLESYDNSTKFPVIDTENKIDGKGSAKAEVTIDGNANCATIFEAYYSQMKDLSFYQGREDAYLHVWVNLSNAAWFRNDVDARLELSSGGSYAANVVYYDLTQQTFEDGWNELFIPVSELQSMNNGDFDWSKVNYIRLFMHHIRFGGATGQQTVNVDQLEIGLKSDFTVPEHPDTPLKVEGFDNVNQFPVNTENKKEGTGSAMVTADGATVITWIQNIYSQKKDLSFYQDNADAYLRFWMYIEDASLLSRNQEMYLEIGSGGNFSSGIARYNLADTSLKDGWNEVVLPVSGFERHSDPAVTACDWSAVNYIRLYVFSAGAAGAEITQTMGIDGMYIGLKSDFDVPPESTSRVIESFDSPNKFTVDTDNKKEGKGSAIVQASGRGDLLTQIESTYAKPMNLTRYIRGKDAYLHLWVYLEDASLINRDMDGYLEIGSGGAWNAGIARYDITRLALSDGWNELLIPVSAFERHSDASVTPCDWSRINYIRLYLFGAAPGGGRISQTLGVDELSIGTAPDFADARPVGALYSGTELRVIESYDNARKFNVDTGNKKEGYGAAMVTASGNENVLTQIESTYTKPKDLSAFANRKDAYIRFWLYLKDASAFNRTTDAYLEFSSGGAWNARVSRFNITSLENLQDGWNKVLIPVSKMQAHTDPAVGACDWSGVNYIRVYLFSSIPGGGELSQTMGIDGLSIGLASEFDLPEKEAVLPVEHYDDPHRFTINTEDFREGTGAAMTVTESAGNILTAIESSYSYTKDLSEYAASSDGCVAFWLYIKDASYFNRELDAFLEFSSGGFWGAEVARYDVTKLDLQDGWNRVVIPLVEFDRSPDPTLEECDWSRVNYIRFYLFNTISGGSEPQTLMIDGLTVGHMPAFLTDATQGLDRLATNATMATDGYAKAANADGKMPTVVRWIVIGCAQAVVIAAAVVTTVVLVKKNRKKGNHLRTD